MQRGALDGLSKELSLEVMSGTWSSLDPQLDGPLFGLLLGVGVRVENADSTGDKILARGKRLSGARAALPVNEPMISLAIGLPFSLTPVSASLEICSNFSNCGKLSKIVELPCEGKGVLSFCVLCGEVRLVVSVP